MCGIAGILSDRPGEFRRPMEAMLEAMAHRGPDDSGVAVLEPPLVPGTIVLGSRRLSILDRSPLGHQPMRDPETGNWITYNGEVYNFPEIRKELEARGTRFSSSGDTEVLLRSYGQVGLSALNQWRGMFAFAIWDAQRNQLLLARDRLGIKPLYYWQQPGLFIFASEVRALLASGLVPRNLDPSGVATFLSFGAVQDPLTLVRGVQALLPGHVAIIRSGEINSSAYWELPPPTGRLHTNRQMLVDELCHRLEESVGIHLVSDVPVGIFLSGGLDSSLVALLAQRHSTQPISTYTVAFHSPGANEGPRGRAMARAIGTQHEELVVDCSDLQGRLSAALLAMDQPTINGLNSYLIAQAVHSRNLKVALSGLGGDELFAGYPTFQRSLWFQRIPRFIRRPITRGLATIDPLRDRSEQWQLLGHWENQLGHPLIGLRTVFGPRLTAQLLGVESGPHGWGLFVSVHDNLLESSKRYDPVNRISALELKLYLPNMLLRDTDGLSMAHSLEVRVPFLDHLLVEWTFRIPGWKKLGVIPKPLLAAALRRLLPKADLPPIKTGFVVPLETWLRQNGPLRQQIDAAFQDRKGLAKAGLPYGLIRQIWEEFLRRQRGWAQPWALFVLKRWVETNLS